MAAQASAHVPGAAPACIAVIRLQQQAPRRRAGVVFDRHRRRGVRVVARAGAIEIAGKADRAEARAAGSSGRRGPVEGEVDRSVGQARAQAGVGVAQVEPAVAHARSGVAVGGREQARVTAIREDRGGAETPELLTRIGEGCDQTVGRAGGPRGWNPRQDETAVAGVDLAVDVAVGAVAEVGRFSRLPFDAARIEPRGRARQRQERGGGGVQQDERGGEGARSGGVRHGRLRGYPRVAAPGGSRKSAGGSGAGLESAIGASTF